MEATNGLDISLEKKMPQDCGGSLLFAVSLDPPDGPTRRVVAAPIPRATRLRVVEPHDQAATTSRRFGKRSSAVYAPGITGTRMPVLEVAKAPKLERLKIIASLPAELS